MAELHLFWTKKEMSLAPSSDILSFLSPSEDEQLSGHYPSGFISARALAIQEKEEIIEQYIHFVASVGATRLPDFQNKTLRQLLSPKEGENEWWAHPFAIKNSESDVEYEWVVAANLIDRLATKKQADTLVFYGAPRELVDALKGAYQVREVASYSHYSALTLAKAVVYRIGYALHFFWNTFRLKRYIPKRTISFDTAFVGFWDWSIKKEGNTFQDKYFKRLPQKMQEKGSQIGWLLWLEPKYEACLKASSLYEVLQPLMNQNNMVFLNHFISLRKLVFSFFDLRSFFVLYKLYLDKKLNSIFVHKNINYLSIFKKKMFSGFLSHRQLESRLVFQASKSALNTSSLKSVFHFLELFPFSRSIYASTRHVARPPLHFVVQHASYGEEKTFGRIDPILEKKGDPDGLSCPMPDYIFAMGEQGKRVFEKNGVECDYVPLTGSSRYEELTQKNLKPVRQKVLRILVPTSLSAEIEWEVLDAVCAATKGDFRFEVRLRSHPFFKIENEPKFKQWKDQLTVSKSRTLEEELSQADVVVYAYSTVGEEAQVYGIPVIHWASWRFSGEAFQEKRPAAVGTISALKNALNTIYYQERLEPQDLSESIQQYFYKLDAGASDRIAEVAHRILGEKKQK